MKWARFLSALSKVFVGMFVKNRKSQEVAQGLEEVADLQIEAVGELIDQSKKN